MRKNDFTLRKDHETIRNNVGFYVFTHQILEVNGKDATKFLDYIFLNTIHNTKLDGAKYTTMLNEDGIIIDDVIVFRLEENLYWVSTLYIIEMIQWFDKHKADYDIEYRNVTKDVAMWAVQGPDSRNVLNKILEYKLDDMKFFDFKKNKLDNIDIKVSRSGFTGELGYELYFEPRYGDIVRKELFEKGAEFNIEEIKSDVILTSIPGEKGYILMSDLQGLNPFEAGFAWSVHLDKDFIGKEALEKITVEDAKQRLLGYTTEEEVDINPGALVKVNGKEVGKVTKATYGYTIEKYFGYIVLDKEYANIGENIDIVDGDKVIKAIVTDRIFYDIDDKRRFGR